MTSLLYDCPIREIPDSDRVIVETLPCPVCDATQARPAFQMVGLPLRVVVCADCGLGRLHPFPQPDEIAGFYPPEYYGTAGAKFTPWVETLVRRTAARSAKQLVRGLPRGACVLDVGCGRGVLLGTLADLGMEVHGFEVSDSAAAGADPRAEIRIAPDLNDAEYPAERFDLVVIWHVLEHVYDPRRTIAEIHRVLKPGGRVVVAVPNFSSWQARWAGPAWFHLDLPRHLHHFPLAALERLLARCGFECGKVHHFSLRQNPFGWVQSALNRSHRYPRNTLYTLLQTKGGGERLPKRLRGELRAAYLLGMPVALGVSLFAAALRSGATIDITARKPHA
ncbi:MAG: class I SAM-dependent methyltransferase [Planctomycetaceae bacterium]